MVWLGMVGRVVLGVGRVLGLGVVMMIVRPVVDDDTVFIHSTLELK